MFVPLRRQSCLKFLGHALPMRFNPFVFADSSSFFRHQCANRLVATIHSSTVVTQKRQPLHASITCAAMRISLCHSFLLSPRFSGGLSDSQGFLIIPQDSFIQQHNPMDKVQISLDQSNYYFTHGLDQFHSIVECQKKIEKFDSSAILYIDLLSFSQPRKLSLADRTLANT